MEKKEAEFLPNGIRLGAATITALCSDEKKGWYEFSIKTKKHKAHWGICVYVTKSGKLRFFYGDGDEKEEFELVKKK